MAIYHQKCKSFFTTKHTPEAHEFDYATVEILNDEAENSFVNLIKYSMENHEAVVEEVRDLTANYLRIMLGTQEQAYSIADILIDKAIDKMEPNLRALLKEMTHGSILAYSKTIPVK